MFHAKESHTNSNQNMINSIQNVHFYYIHPYPNVLDKIPIQKMDETSCSKLTIDQGLNWINPLEHITDCSIMASNKFLQQKDKRPRPTKSVTVTNTNNKKSLQKANISLR